MGYFKASILIFLSFPAAAVFAETPSPFAVTRSSGPVIGPIPFVPMPVQPPAPDAPPAESSEQPPREAFRAPTPPPPPVEAQRPEQAAPRPAARKTISLDLRDMDVVEVLKILSKQGNTNIVIGKNVSGKVTVFLTNVDFWDALRTILETRDLAYVKEGDLVRVVTAQDYEKNYGSSFGEKTELRSYSFRNIKAKSAKDVLDPLKSKVGSLVVNEVTNTLLVRETPDQLAQFEEMIRGMDVPVETRVFNLSHGGVEELMPKVQPLISKDYGTLQADKRSNTLIVTDNPERVAEVAAVVKAFDVRERSVLIEAKIVQVVLGDRFQYGINWDRAFRYERDGNSAYAGGAVFNSNALLVPLQSYKRNPVTGTDVAALSGITANLTALTGIQVAGALNFLQTVGKTKILSSPRIVALNGQEAKILVGSKEAYVTTTVLTPGGTSSTTSTEQVNFVEVGVKLFVTPMIGEDGFLTLKVKPEVSSVESTIKTASGNTVPIVRISQAETSLVVKDGVTVLIGGLIEEKKVDTKAGVPFLSQIPILGLPFRSQDTNNQKTELVIFLTPKIFSGEASSPEAQSYLPEKEWPQDLPKKKKGFFRRLFSWKES